MEDLFIRVKNIIDTMQLLPTGCAVIAGVSGGPDSMALLAILAKLRNSSDFILRAAHINHGLRENADKEADLVREWCLHNNIPLSEKNVNLKDIARSRKCGLEEAGRDVRREYFHDCEKQTREQYGEELIVRIALAHHIQDQAETIVLNLGRGSGLDGLTGMSIFEPPFIHPLLQIDPGDIKKWLEMENIPWLMDESNNDIFFTRNRIRHILLPAWEQIIGYNPVPMIARAAENLTQDKEYFDMESEKAYQISVIRNYCKHAVGIDCNILNRYQDAIKFRVLRKYYAETTGTLRDFSKVHADMMQSVLQDSSGPFNLPSGHIVNRTGDLLRIEKSQGDFLNIQTVVDDFETDLLIPGDTRLPDGLGFIRSEIIEYQVDFRYNSQINCFNRQALAGCKVRFRRSGDRIRPVNRSGSRSLKKYMNEQRMPLSERCITPLVARDSEVVWLPGYACGQEFCLIDSKTAPGRNTDSSDLNRQEGVRLSWILDEDHDNVSVDTSS